MSHKTLVKKRTYISELNDIIKNKKNVIYWPHNLNANRHTFDINTCKVEDHSALNIAPQQTPPPLPMVYQNSRMVNNTNTIIEDGALNNLLLPREEQLVHGELA